MNNNTLGIKLTVSSIMYDKNSFITVRYLVKDLQTNKMTF